MKTWVLVATTLTCLSNVYGHATMSKLCRIVPPVSESERRVPGDPQNVSSNRCLVDFTGMLAQGICRYKR